MYLYFDKNGVLQEVINDKKVRSASAGANRIFAYIEGDLEIDEINIVVKRADGLLSNEVSILNNKINASIPYDQKRDMKFFKDFVEYSFYYYDLSFNDVQYSGLAYATITIYADGKAYAQGMVTFNIEQSVIKTDNLITQSQYQYLLLSYASRTLNEQTGSDLDSIITEKVDSHMDRKYDEKFDLYKNQIDSRIELQNEKIANLIDGSPRDVYDNLEALQTAYPTGASGVYITSDNGHWHYWNGSAWTDGGVYHSSEDVKQLKEDLNEFNSRLSDISEMSSYRVIDRFEKTDGYLNHLNGQKVTNASYWYSQNFTVKKGDTIKANVSGQAALAIGVYRQDGTWVSADSKMYVSGVTYYETKVSQDGYVIVSSIKSFEHPTLEIPNTSKLLDTVISTKESVEEIKSIIMDDSIECDFNNTIGNFNFLSDTRQNPVFTPFGYRGKNGFVMSTEKQALWLNTNGMDLNKIGIGIMFRPMQKSADCDPYGMYIFHGYRDDNNEFYLEYRTPMKKFFFVLRQDGTLYSKDLKAPWNDTVEFDENELIGLYIHLVSDRCVNIYLMIKGIVSVNTVYINNLPIVSVNTLGIGLRYRGGMTGSLGYNATRQANCIFANFKMEFGDDIRPIEYFEEVM